MNTDFKLTAADYILSGHALLHCPTTETTRFLAELKSLASDLPSGGHQVFTWSHATGWRGAEGNPQRDNRVAHAMQHEHNDDRVLAERVQGEPEARVEREGKRKGGSEPNRTPGRRSLAGESIHLRRSYSCTRVVDSQRIGPQGIDEEHDDVTSLRVVATFDTGLTSEYRRSRERHLGPIRL